ncbi:MAG TPA: metal-sensing transcriptional repressor [Candidatus Saccharimonadales bacterium]|nr:metal-sensing transcriptional repressor [Candidatus Saccharimonadales bacterium]
MPGEDTRKLKGRLNRLKGQVEGLTKLLENDDPVMVIIQMKAVIAAAKGCLNSYAEMVVDEASETDRHKIIRQIITS